MAVDASRAKSLFQAASDLPDPAQRAAYLDRECGGDVELQEQVEALLRANNAAHFLSANTDEGTSAYTADRPLPTLDYGDPTARIGSIIGGKYKLIEEIGEGGMGSVYLAQQAEPVKRAVAIKVIKAGMDSKAVLTRFEAERQALAIMDHPNIAKVLDAGTTDGGRPYFVMELVKGLPITKFCDERKLTPRQRLELFVPVCQAIQHAHQKGVIHRDIKPSNVLVAMYDDRPVPKVIDFGVAKAAGQTLTDKTLMTGLGAVVGTPEYMSPEQANVNNMDIDTRSDVYSLGVLLYELLTGTTPVDRKSLGKEAMLEILRIVREVEAPKPSSKLSTIDALPSVAANRGTEPQKLSKLMKGELDWVVLKALEKDRTRRYDTANGLARDIQRYLADEMVEARPPSTGYRLKKFVRRHKGQVAAAAIILLTLFGGILGTTLGLFEARHQRDEAETARTKETEQRQQAEVQRDRATAAEKLAKSERDRANQEAARATQEAARATAINSFVEQMFLSVDPEEKGSREVTVLELVNKASEKADKTLANQPQVEAAVRTLLGRTLNSLGKTPEAIRQLELALTVRKNGIDANTYAHFETLQGLGSSHFAKGDYKEALAAHLQALSILTTLGDQHLPEMGIQHRHIARTLIKLSRYPEAEQHIHQCDEIFKRLPQISPGDRGSLAGIKSMLVQHWKGDLESAEKFIAEALIFMREEGRETSIADELNSLAVLKMQRGKYDEAIPLYEEAIAIIRRVQGDVHPELALKLENLANAWYRKKDYAEATDLLNQVAAMRDKLFGPGSFPGARTRFNLAIVLSNQGNQQKAVETFDQVLPIFRKHVGDKSTEVATVLQNRGTCRKELKEFDAAHKDYQAALEIADAINKPVGNLRLKILFELTQLYRLRGNKQRTDETMKLATSVLDPTKPDQQTWIKKFADLPASGVVEEKKP